MAKKQMAYYKTVTGYKPVHIYQAIKMKNSLIKNRDENLEFYDTPNDTVAERLSPVRTSKDGKAAHFSYYPNSKRSGSGSEKTMTHRMYEIVLSEVDMVKLSAFGEEITVFVEEALPNFYFNTAYNYYYIDVMLKLKGTEPKSYFYKWGGRLAIEIFVSHKVDKSKANDLQLSGIQIFEAKIYSNQRVPENILDERQFNYYKEIVKGRIVQKLVIGKFVNTVCPPTGSLMEKRYLEMEKYEQEIKIQQNVVLENNEIIAKQREEVSSYNKQLELLKRQEEALNNKMTEKEKQLKSLNDIVTKNSILSRNNQELENKIKQLETDLFEERNKSLLKKLFGHFFAARKA